MNTTPSTLAGHTALVTGSIAPVLARVPSHRMSTVAEVAAAVVLLAGPHADNIHGTILTVDGGATAV